jgi:hypothetical protein
MRKNRLGTPVDGEGESSELLLLVIFVFVLFSIYFDEEDTTPLFFFIFCAVFRQVSICDLKRI